ncbi:albumin-2-like [Elaeis guineensis]|uniref:albumin-2-like n=1 Tax=Elaeis guineensis var. tenera TaxID=51953 RepID=UPI003C6CCC63
MHACRFTRAARVDNTIKVNGRFNPQSHPSRLLNIRRPVFDYRAENGTAANLVINVYRPQRDKREASTDPNSAEWYAGKVADFKSYINAAFRSSRQSEAYLFMKNEYVRVNYAPGTTGDWVVNGPLLICNGFPTLTDAAFAEYGIDCAFGSHDGSEAFVFSMNLCAQISYTPGTTNDKISKGPMTIAAMFPFFKRTVFESGVDAAFESTTSYEAYLFKGNQYALINYGSDSHLIAIRLITQGFPSLKNTIFESGIDAAFASHRYNEAYLFKGDSYALINFAPATTDDYIIGGVKKISSHWPSLRSILPRKNRGLDVHDHTIPDARSHRDHDEL